MTVNFSQIQEGGGGIQLPNCGEIQSNFKGIYSDKFIIQIDTKTCIENETPSTFLQAAVIEQDKIRGEELVYTRETH